MAVTRDLSTKQLETYDQGRRLVKKPQKATRQPRELQVGAIKLMWVTGAGALIQSD